MDELMEMKFPHYTAGNETLHEIFGDFVELDAYVAGLVTSYLTNVTPYPTKAPVDENFVRVDEDINKKLNSATPKSEQESMALEKFIARKKKLDELTLTLKQLLEEDKKQG